jgi:hypothetical protein
MKKKLIPALLTAVLAGMTVNSVYAADADDVGSVTMDVMEHNDPHEVTNDIQLPDQASDTAKEHVAGADDSHDNKSEDMHENSEAEDHESSMSEAKDEAKDDAMDDAKDDASDAAEQEAHDAMQESSDMAQDQGK